VKAPGKSAVAQAVLADQSPVHSAAGVVIRSASNAGVPIANASGASALTGVSAVTGVSALTGVSTGASGAGAAVALQRVTHQHVAHREVEGLGLEPIQEPNHGELDGALDGELDPELDTELENEFEDEPRYSSRSLGATHPFESLNGQDYDPTANMTPEQRRAMRDQVVIEHLPLVRAIAVRVHENLPVHVELDDLVHAGIMGLFDASSKYNPEKRVAFSSYAKHRIKGAILDSLRQLDWASRDLRRRHKQIEQATRELAATLHRNPTEEEVAGKMGVEVDRWRQMMLDLRNVGLISASTRGTEHDDLPAPDFPAKPELHPDSMSA